MSKKAMNDKRITVGEATKIIITSGVATIAGDVERYAKDYDENKFLNKMKKFGKTMGVDLYYMGYVIWNMLKDPTVPMTDKLKMAGALAYVVLPVDLIPDVVIGMGFADDLYMVKVTIQNVAKSIRPEAMKDAREKAIKLFGKDVESAIDKVDKFVINPFRAIAPQLQFKQKGIDEGDIIDVNFKETNE